MISDGMALKIAGSGLAMRHLALAYQRDQSSGIEKLFSQTVAGKVRVTKSERIIAAVNDYFSAKASDPS